MRSRWVDNHVYNGRCRRAAGGRRLILERRRVDGAEEMPSLAAQLRRLRVRLFNLHDEDREAVVRLTSAAAGVAMEEGRHLCAAFIAQANAHIAKGEDVLADAQLVFAMGELEQEPGAPLR